MTTKLTTLVTEQEQPTPVVKPMKRGRKLIIDKLADFFQRDGDSVNVGVKRRTQGRVKSQLNINNLRS